MDAIAIFKRICPSRTLHGWIYKRVIPNHFFFQKQDFSYITTKRGVHFYINDELHTVCDCLHEYDYSLIKNTDIVIDVGANIGGFSLHAAQITPKVNAIEPVFYKELLRNIDLNNGDMFSVYPMALGDGSTIDITFENRTVKNVLSMPLHRFKDLFGGCDVLKCDAEGAEWCINTEELDGIRVIQMELHRFGKDHKQKFTALMKYLNDNYTVMYDPDPIRRETYGIVHAYK
jgi:FkbM family methyltransferase